MMNQSASTANKLSMPSTSVAANRVLLTETIENHENRMKNRNMKKMHRRVSTCDGTIKNAEEPSRSLFVKAKQASCAGSGVQKKTGGGIAPKINLNLFSRSITGASALAMNETHFDTNHDNETSDAAHYYQTGASSNGPLAF